MLYTYVEMMTVGVESNMKRVSLELGGKSALIVLEDAGPPSYIYVQLKYMYV